MALYYCGFDVINMINLVLCALILALGCLIYARTRMKEPFHIGIAFGLFAVSHAIALFGLHGSFAATMVLIRLFAYLIVLSSLWEMRSKA